MTSAYRTGIETRETLAAFVVRHHEDVSTSEFRRAALLGLAVAGLIASAAAYAGVTARQQACAVTLACEAWVAPGTRGPLQEPISRDVVPAKADAERRSWSRS